MSDTTKVRALKKLDSMICKIAFPDKWRDYSKLEINADDLVGNIMRGNEFEYNRQIGKLGKPVDRTQWLMTPQTINAYYEPMRNEIVFPAAILQRPFFNVNADDAVNYGGIGAVIGHEISHAFDDQGSQYDEMGNLNNWWTASDRKQFSNKTRALVDQYNTYSPLPDYYVNGELTLGENIADNSGLAIAYKAYHLSLGENAAPIINGLTGDQRLYLGWAEVWRAKIRDPQMIGMIKSNPHSPPQFRCNGPLRNQPGFYDAYGIKSGDKLYLSPDKRVIIW
ncbi:MAG: Peptidase [Burkholderiales bacterium]|nr:Peptidase [Burkholderiales bacterium]